MRTLSFSQKPSYSANMVHHYDIPSATTRLPGGVASGFLAGSKIASSCYVIEEEQPSEGQVDDNGNNQRSELDTSCGNTGVAKDNFAEKGIDNFTNSDNTIINHQPARLFQSFNSVNEVNQSPSWKNLSSIRCSFSDRSNEKVYLSPQVSNKTSFHDLRQQHASSPHTSDLRQQHASSPHTSDVKSGNLLLIIPEQKVNLKSDCSFLSSSRPLPRRCPVIVKIHDKGYEKYAIISSTRRQSTFPPFCLKLKHSYVTQPASNPSCFNVVIDISEGKTFTFEASSPDLAREWIQAFTHTDSSLPWSNPTKCLAETSSETTEQSQHVTISKSVHAMLSLSNLPVLSESVEEGDEE